MGGLTPALRGHIAMLLFSALVAGSFSLGVMVANEIAPAALNAARFALAAVLIGAVALGTRKFRASHFRAPWRFLVLGGLFAAYFVLMFYGLKTADPVSASAVFTLTPVMSGVFGWILLRQVTTPRMALALAIGATGALWVIFRADWSAFTAFEIGQGEMIYFIGCVSHAVYTPMVRKLNRGEPAVVFTFGMLIAGGVILTVFGWNDIRSTDWLNLPGIVWIGLFYLAIFASATTFVLLQYATLHLPSAKVMAYTYLTPSWVIVWEIALGRPVPSGLLLVGIALTVIALVLLLENDAKPARAPT
ncbi:DMT family transporter [Phaeobacter gallaeciensis]|uniref:DMT family transporter n=1 Tax=Phaeobacter gallaeciensis TaxID=60890 RepID=UPI00237FC70D|nr:DMT family transporter [Phaeobacter gallaeciensis]MDE4098422.1 DMT family transporter [Phaeobacter gallaeciensis]MDE4107232.1 DMT family transporter [Phaeobacter gallaeciensis]MDE4111816.1 DMT family transporter [Phaeobacter gallaeciensis]MDE4116157.1 DMT family transporter [Phaeobacter gallaeciensis]MDE4120628.1 DMT family transporter [Phaeobacter gallaeciensis]